MNAGDGSFEHGARESVYALASRIWKNAAGGGAAGGGETPASGEMPASGENSAGGETPPESAERRWLGPFDFALLRTQLLLAAVDGEVSESELRRFRSAVGEFKDNVGGWTVDALWKSALRGAGYLLLQARLLPRDELVREFVKEAGADLVEDLAKADDGVRRALTDALETMGAADGEYSEIERACVLALASSVREERDAARFSRFAPRGV